MNEVTSTIGLINAAYFLHCYVQKPWFFGPDRLVGLLHERNRFKDLPLRLSYEAKRRKSSTEMTTKPSKKVKTPKKTEKKTIE